MVTAERRRTSTSPVQSDRRKGLRTKAPLRVSFAGGGTDVPPFPEREGGVVLSAAINRYAYASLAPRSDGSITVQSADYNLALEFDGTRPPTLDGRLDLVKAAIRRIGVEERRGYDLFLRSGAPPGSGLGSSSSVMVALVTLLDDYYALGLSNYEIAQLAWSIEREDLGITGGAQDQYAATFGGFNYIEFGADQVIVNPLRIDQSSICELEHNVMLCFTGTTRASSQVIDDQTARVVAGEQETTEGMRAQKDLAAEMKRLLLQHRMDDFGSLLGESWEQKKRLSPKVSNPFIDELYSTARAAGALGGKVTGAGGGGYMLLYCQFERRQKVVEAVEKMGVVVGDISFETQGCVTWRH